MSQRFIRSGSTRFETLVWDLMKSSYDRLMFLTLNYDLFLGKALSVYEGGWQAKNTASYLFERHSRWSLIKLHGSVNWGRELLNQPSTENEAVRVMDAMNEEPQFSTTVNVLLGHTDAHRFLNGKFHYPALAVPIEGKQEFVCPKNHLAQADKFLRECTDFLIIGFGALDQHVLGLLENVPSVNKLMVVCGNLASSKEVLRSR